MKPLVSSLPPLVPVSVIDAITGEIMSIEDLNGELELLLSFVQKQSILLWEINKESLPELLENVKVKAPAEVARQIGLNIDLTILPRDVKAKSRINRLVQYSTITLAKSYINSPVITKVEPSFPLMINLGSVDAQMAILKREDQQLVLSFKCWEREFILIFDIPYYVQERNIQRFTLPLIKPVKDGYGFIFTALETPGQNPKSPYVAGIDLGRVEPFTMVILNETTRKRVAVFTASDRIQHIIRKKDRINEHLGFINKRIDAYSALTIDKGVLVTERDRLRVKRNRLNRKVSWLMAAEISAHALPYSPRFVAIEDLSWVAPKHGMSRWSHSQDQVAITHKLSRYGMQTKKISPRNTSQDCSKCGEKIKHIDGKRLIVCSACSLILDRDINAAINIANRPLPKRSKGNNCSVRTQVIARDSATKRFLTRKTRLTRLAG